jgi:hypothetical protein
VFALLQMFTQAANVYRQKFVVRSAEVRKMTGSDPNYSQILPMELATRQIPRLQLEKLGFLLRSHDPDILNRMAVTAMDFEVLMNLLEKRNVAHLEWQRASEPVFADPTLPGPISIEVLEDRIGAQRSVMLKLMTDELRERLPECAGNLERIGKQLTDVLSLMYPSHRINRFDRLERQDAVAPPPSTPKARLWRRAVRAVARTLRTPLGVHRKSSRQEA